MASVREFDKSSVDQRPQVQVGDPFMEKLLLESCQVMNEGRCDNSNTRHGS